MKKIQFSIDMLLLLTIIIVLFITSGCTSQIETNQQKILQGKDYVFYTGHDNDLMAKQFDDANLPYYCEKMPSAEWAWCIAGDIKQFNINREIQ